MKMIRILTTGLLLLLLTAGLLPAGQISAADGKTELLLMISGNYPGAMEKGSESRFYLTVKNNGDVNITNIKFGHSAPEGLSVGFLPDNLAILTPGSSTTIDVVLMVDQNASTGDYNVNLIADSGDTQTRAVTNLYVRVEGSSYSWGWVGLGIGLAAVAVFLLIYLRWGRTSK